MRTFALPDIFGYFCTFRARCVAPAARRLFRRRPRRRGFLARTLPASGRRNSRRAAGVTIAIVRAGWNEYFMGIAHQAATRSTCPRKHVGAVIVRDKTVLSTGYNGSIRGLPHCDEIGCVMEDGHCITTVHAEANAILQAAKNGVGVDGGELYTTASPCWNCFKLIANSGIRKIYYGEFYRDERARQVADQVGIELVDLRMPAPVGA
jgi:dCMP deaminase